jgi:uncharacterized repeat protein (TIGR02543 family)
MNKKNLYSGAAASLLLLFLACEMMGPEAGTESGPAGKAAVRIGIDGINAAGLQARTVLPTVALGDVTSWELWGGKSGEIETKLTNFSGTSTMVYLETAYWNFTLKGYKGNDIILRGIITSKNITLDGPNVLSFTAAPVFDSNEPGTFKISIHLPPGHGITTVKILWYEVWLDTTLAPVNDTVVYESEPLMAIDHYFCFRFYKDNELYGVLSELVQVRANLRSETTYTLGLEDLNRRYVITYHLNGGSGVTTPGYYRSTDAAFALPAPTREGYTFGGWYATSDLSGAPVTGVTQGSMEDKDFYAKWTANAPPPPIQYTVTFDSHGGSAVQALTANAGTTVNQPAAPTRAGYTFLGWYSAASGGTPYTIWPYTVNANVTMHAQWQENAPPPPTQYTITFESNGGSEVAAMTVNAGTSATKPNDPTRTGYTFRGWYNVVSGGVGYGWPYTPTGNVTMHAQWTLNSAGQTIILTIANFTGLSDPAQGTFTDTAFTLTRPAGSKTITVTDSATDISWYVGLVKIAEGNSVTLNLNVLNLSPGPHILRVTAKYGGVLYSKELTFTVNG